MATVQALIENIIRELTVLQKLPASIIDENDEFRLPRLIAVGNKGSLVVSSKIDQAITSIADQLMDSDPTRAKKYTQSEWRASVRQAFGPALYSIDLASDLSTNAETVLTDIKRALGKQLLGHGVREYAFGCTLFQNTVVQSFPIGPVRFESRLDWLARKHLEGGISTTIRRRVEQAWKGKRLRKRKPSSSSFSETDILDSIGNCAFVCSVATNGLAPEAGREKALTAARLAVATIALSWQTPSKALEGMNLLFDRTPHMQRALVFVPGRVVLAGSRWSHSLHGSILRSGEWERIFSEARDLFGVWGDVLNYVVSPTGAVARPKMMNTLTQALMWFHEGCREPVSLMAIVKFSAVLDALACGKKAAGIRHLVNMRLKIQDSAPIRADGPTLNRAIEEIYNYGRSRTIHGTNEKLGHDWSGTRGLAEQFARLCLLASVEWAANNSSSDDPAKLSQ